MKFCNTFCWRILYLCIVYYKLEAAPCILFSAELFSTATKKLREGYGVSNFNHLQHMKKTTTLFASAVASAFFLLMASGCSNTEPQSTTATVNMAAEADGSKATAAFMKSPSPTSGIVADSVEVTRVRFLLSKVKLHIEGNDTTHDGEIKAGPFVLEFTPGFTRVFSTVTLPAGTYEKIKFEIHKFPSSIDQLYLNDPIFTDFVSNERSTVIIEGRVWSAGIATPTNFVYKSHITANLEAKFGNQVVLAGGSTTTLSLLFSPKLTFKSINVLDPRDPDNAKEIDEFIKGAIKALKK